MIRKQFGRLFALIFMVFLVAYALTHQEIISPILDVSLPVVVAIALLKILQMIVNGLYTKFCLDAFNKPITYKESSYIAILSSLGNYFGPLLGGMGVRATYLKAKYDFAVVHFIGTLYGYYLFVFFTTSIIGLLGSLLVYRSEGVYSHVLTLFFLGTLLLTGLMFFVKPPKKNVRTSSKSLNWFFRKLQEVSEGWNFILRHEGLFLKLVVLSLLVFIISLTVSFLEFSALNIDTNFGSLLLYTSIGSMSLLVSFTPGAIGIKEAIYVFTSNVLLITNLDVLKISALDRGISLIVLILTYGVLQLLKAHRAKDTQD